jgi:hypothetical protein
MSHDLPRAGEKKVWTSPLVIRADRAENVSHQGKRPIAQRGGGGEANADGSPSRRGRRGDGNEERGQMGQHRRVSRARSSAGATHAHAGRRILHARRLHPARLGLPSYTPTWRAARGARASVPSPAWSPGRRGHTPAAAPASSLTVQAGAQFCNTGNIRGAVSSSVTQEEQGI